MPLLTIAPATFSLFKDEVNNMYRGDLTEASTNLRVENMVIDGVVSFPLPADGNASGFTHVRDTNKLWMIHNGNSDIYEYNENDLSTRIRTIHLVGLSLGDGEGVHFMGWNDEALSGAGGYEFVVAFEGGGNSVIGIFEMSEAELTATDVEIDIGVLQELTIYPHNAIEINSGPEGVCYDRFNKIFYVVNEGQEEFADRHFFRVERPVDRVTNYDHTQPELVVTEPWIAETVFNSYGPLGSDFDLAEVYFHEATGTVIILSQIGELALQMNPVTAEVLSTLVIPTGQQWEGFTLIGDNCIVLGEFPAYQRFNYVEPA